jgi:hypothetical protein
VAVTWSDGAGASLEESIAFRYLWTRSTAPDGSRTAFDSFGAGFRSDRVGFMRGVATRAAFEGAIAAGGADVDGLIRGALAAGGRTTPSEDAGLLGRIGLHGNYEANQRFRRGTFELPRGEFGFQVITDDSFFELTGHGGLAFPGRFDNEFASRISTFAFAWGAGLAVGLGGLRASVDATRTESKDGRLTRPIDEVDGTICISPSVPLLFCGGGTYVSTDGLDGAGAAAPLQTVRFGLSVGAGQVRQARKLRDKVPPFVSHWSGDDEEEDGAGDKPSTPSPGAPKDEKPPINARAAGVAGSR